MKFNSDNVNFTKNGTDYSFNIIHNMGHDIYDALMNWIPRTNEYSDVSFCKYVNDKNSGHLAYTKNDWELVNQERIKN
jgi:hypothetical protein